MKQLDVATVSMIWGGSVYIYQQDFETKDWILQQKLIADDGSEYDELGSSVAIHGDTLVVGECEYKDDDK